MQTIEINLYSFSELSEEAKRKALDNYESYHDESFYSDELIESVKQLCDVFNLKTGNRYTDLRTDWIDYDVLNLSGIRLMKYIINNYDRYLFEGKFYCTPFRNGTYKHRYSKIIKDNSCTLTGCGYDMAILDPVYKFLKKPCKYTTFEDLIKQIESAIYKVFEDIDEWVNSDEYKTDNFEANEYLFTEDGKVWI